MTDFWGHMAGVITLILMAVFIGIWIWAWRPRHRKNFERMARVPLEGDDRPDENETADPDQADTSSEHQESDQRFSQ